MGQANTGELSDPEAVLTKLESFHHVLLFLDPAAAYFLEIGWGRISLASHFPNLQIFVEYLKDLEVVHYGKLNL